MVSEGFADPTRCSGNCIDTLSWVSSSWVSLTAGCVHGGRHPAQYANAVEPNSDAITAAISVKRLRRVAPAFASDSRRRRRVWAPSSTPSSA
jgi:hypothetical protein